MFKRTTFLVLLASIAFVGCKKDDTNNPDDPFYGGPTSGEYPILLSAEFNEVDVNNTFRMFKGEAGVPWEGNGEFLGSRAFNTTTGEAAFFNIFARQQGGEANISLTIYLEDGKELSEREYDLYDPEFDIMFEFVDDSGVGIHAIASSMVGGNFEYNGEIITPTGKINITKYAANLLQGTFEFEAYTVSSPTRKVIVKNGTFNGKWRTINL